MRVDLVRPVKDSAPLSKGVHRYGSLSIIVLFFVGLLLSEVGVFVDLSSRCVLLLGGFLVLVRVLLLEVACHIFNFFYIIISKSKLNTKI